MLKKLIYYTTLFNSCQEKGFIIMDDDDLVILAQAVIEAVKECADASMLELVLELLIR